MRIAITGGAGFIGSALIRHLINETDCHVLNIDLLTYAGNLNSLPGVDGNERYSFRQLDICDTPAVRKAFEEFQPDAVMHLAAESHVDRSIDSPAGFIKTNVLGTGSMLEAALDYWKSSGAPSEFVFHHISTDEVYGDLGATGLFTEETPYEPSSPYSASKAGSDHLVRAWCRTYDMPVVITNCSNNYGPYQFPEKLIPLMVQNALAGKPLPVYGDGSQIRDWLYVDDHVQALLTVIRDGKTGETYNIGGHNEKTNLEVVHTICSLLADLVEDDRSVDDYLSLITYVDDRPGHDVRYAIDAGKIQAELGWVPKETFETGMRKTIMWYLDNQSWVNSVLDGSYQLQRLGEIA